MSDQIHADGCRCWKCYADQMGRWIDALGADAASGRWQVFATITYATKEFPWCRGFPLMAGRPKADFAHHLFDRFVAHLESELQSRVDYIVADQLGSINGRFHQHAILAGLGLDKLLDWHSHRVPQTNGLHSGSQIAQVIENMAERGEFEPSVQV